MEFSFVRKLSNKIKLSKSDAIDEILKDFGDNKDTKDTKDTENTENTENTEDTVDNQDTVDDTAAPPEQPDLTKTVNELEDKIKTLEYGLKDLKKKKPSLDTDEQDLNNTVIRGKKGQYLKIMDQLDEVAESLVETDPKLSKTIDHIADNLYFYNKS